MKVFVRRLAAALVLPGLVALALPHFVRAAAAPAGTPARSGGSALNSPMPDSVMARVFIGSSTARPRLVTRRQLAQALFRNRLDPATVTPQQRRQFLDLLVDQAVLLERVSHEPRRWSVSDSLEWNAVRDRMVLKAALDSAMLELNFDRAAHGDSLLDRQEIGIALRDSAMAHMDLRWNDEAIGRTVALFDTLPQFRAGMSMPEQLRLAASRPRPSLEDSLMAIVQSRDGAYTIGNLIDDFGRMNPMYRPHLQGASQVREAVGNALYERLLRRSAAERHLERRPDIAGPLAERAEYLDISAYVAREVYQKIPTDSATIRRHFEAHLSDFDADERARVLRVSLGSRTEAEAMARRLTTPLEAESLAAQSARAGIPYESVVPRESDTTYFARLKRAGVGAVLGPDSTKKGWTVVKVMELVPRQHRTWEQGQAMAKQNWYNSESERRMRVLLDGLRKHALVVVNERAIGKGWEGYRPPASRPGMPGGMPGGMPHGMPGGTPPRHP